MTLGKRVGLDDDEWDEPKRKEEEPKSTSFNNDRYSYKSRTDSNNQPITTIVPEISSKPTTPIEKYSTISPKNIKELYDIETLKDKVKEEKSKGESALKEEKEAFKRKEDINTKTIDDIRETYSTDKKFLEDTYKSQIELLKEENRILKQQYEKNLAQERENLTFVHKTALDNQEHIFKTQLESQKKLFEEQNEMLKKQLEQQLEINKLVSKVDSSSKFIDEIVAKIKQDKDQLYENENLNLKNKEHMLKIFEEQVKAREKNVELEKEDLSKFRQELEKRDLEMRKNQNEEKRRIDKEIERINELQRELKALEYNSKEKFEVEKQELLNNIQKEKNECEILRTTLNKQIMEYDSKLKVLNDEKSFFENYKNEANRNIDFKQKNLEEKRKEILAMDVEIKNKTKLLNDKEFYLEEKAERNEATHAELKGLNDRLEREKREIQLAIRSIEAKTKKYEENSRLLENERENLIKRHNELETEKVIINSEKIKIEQQYADLRLRAQNIDVSNVLTKTRC